MVGLLILVKSLDVISCNVARPLHVEVLVIALNHVKTSIFARVDDCIIDVCRV